MSSRIRVADPPHRSVTQPPLRSGHHHHSPPYYRRRHHRGHATTSVATPLAATLASEHRRIHTFLHPLPLPLPLPLLSRSLARSRALSLSLARSLSLSRSRSLPLPISLPLPHTHLLAVEGLGKGSERRVVDAAAQPEHEVEGRLLQGGGGGGGGGGRGEFGGKRGDEWVGVRRRGSFAAVNCSTQVGGVAPAPSGCCSPKGCGRPRAACPQR